MIDPESEDFKLTLQYISYDQITSLKHAIEVLNDLMITQISRDILAESKKFLSSPQLR